MQNEGSLRKRRKRNLAKVQGLSQIQYDEKKDHYDIHGMYRDVNIHNIFRTNYTKENANGDTTINIHLSARDHKSGSSRRTRDPRFSAQYSQPGLDEEKGLENFNSPPTPGPQQLAEDHGRPVLFTKNCMNRFKQIVWLGIFSLAFPWSWNNETHQIELYGPRKWRIWACAWTLTTIQTSGIYMFQIYSFFSRIEKDETGSWLLVFKTSFCVLWYTYATLHNFLMFSSREKIRVYLNTMFRSNKALVDRYIIRLDGNKEGGQALLNVSIPTNITQVLVCVVLFVTFPTLPWFLYHYVYTPDMPWWYLIPGAVQEFLVVGNHMAVYLLVAWIVVVHTSSVDFWLTEAHNNNHLTGYTRDEIRDPHHALELYRAMQVLTNMFNSAMAPVAIPVSKFTNWSATVPCGYVLIRSMNQKFIDEFPGIMTYPFGVIDCVSCAYGMLQISAQMYDMAEGFLTSWSQTKHKELRMYLLSCPVLKVKSGDFYFVTVSTTITYFQSLMDYMIDSIITFP